MNVGQLYEMLCGRKVKKMSGETKQRISELEAEIARLKEAQPTLRDQFAMAALTTVKWSAIFSYSNEYIADIMYDLADAMMEAREK